MEKEIPKRSDTLKSSFQEQESDGQGDGEKGKRRRLRRPPTQGSRRTKSTASSQEEMTKSTLPESEVNPREILETRVKELKKQLWEVEELYKNLSEDVKKARSLYETEQEDCDDVIAVAKRNVEKVVAQILEQQSKKRDLARKIGDSQIEMTTEEKEKRNKQAMEEETRTRNIVIMQTKILILEGKRSERDRLLTKINDAERQLATLDKLNEESFHKAKLEMIEKYERMCYYLQDDIRAISEQINVLSQSQQISALKERQQLILKMQCKYKRAAALLLQLYDQNKELRGKVNSLRQDLHVNTTLAQALAAKTEKAKQEIELEEKQNIKEEAPQLKDDLLHQRRLMLKSHIKELETRCFKMMDYKKELKEILDDQMKYKSILDEKQSQRKLTRTRLKEMSDIAENFIGKKDGKVLTETLEHSDFLQRMSCILMEAVDPENVPESCLSSNLNALYEKGFIGLVPRRSSSRILKKPNSPVKSPARSPASQPADSPVNSVLSFPLQTKLDQVTVHKY